tara:strand:+ start:301 stop:555 length:255 start_codon:yes stop_codon:yes gene_type:complete
MLVVRCRDCQKEITSHPSQTHSCGCPNMMTVKGDSVSAVDLNRVVMISSEKKKKKEEGVLSPQDLSFQEERRKRKVRKLDFEVR